MNHYNQQLDRDSKLVPLEQNSREHRYISLLRNGVSAASTLKKRT